MDKTKINYLVDFLMGLSFVVVAVTGIILFFFLPSGTAQGGYPEFLGVIKKNWTFVHNISGIAMTLLVFLHFVLHLDWIISMTKSFFKK